MRRTLGTGLALRTRHILRSRHVLRRRSILRPRSSLGTRLALRTRRILRSRHILRGRSILRVSRTLRLGRARRTRYTLRTRHTLVLRWSVTRRSCWARNVGARSRGLVVGHCRSRVPGASRRCRRVRMGSHRACPSAARRSRPRNLTISGGGGGVIRRTRLFGRYDSTSAKCSRLCRGRNGRPPMVHRCK